MFGHLAVWAGSPGKNGAAVMPVLAALRTGAGLVTLLSENDVCASLHSIVPEAMSVSLIRQNPFDNAKAINDMAQASGVLLAGPGIGTQDYTRSILKELAGIYKGLLIADADCIACMANDSNLLDAFAGRLILTPHIGEMSKLLGKKYESMSRNLIENAKGFARERKVFLVLKSSNTLIFDPFEDRTWINSTGNSGLAKAGSGDILAGILGSLLVQEKSLSKKQDRAFSIIRALRFGVWLHGKAADLAVQKINKRSLLATDTVDSISAAFNSVDMSSDSPLKSI